MPINKTGCTSFRSVVEDYSMICIKEHENIIKHYGGSSGDAFKKLQNSKKIDLQLVKSWFGQKSATII